MKETKDICTYRPENLQNVSRKMPLPAEIKKLSLLFKAVGDKTRLRILFALLNCELCVCDICSLLDMTKSAISHQLRVLKGLDLVKFRRQGKHSFYFLNDGHVEQIISVACTHIRHKER